MRPTSSSRKNPFRVGEVVIVRNDLSFPGVLWKVVGGTDAGCDLVPLEVLRVPANVASYRFVMYDELDAVDIVWLASARSRLDALIRNLVALRSTDVERSDPSQRG